MSDLSDHSTETVRDPFAAVEAVAEGLVDRPEAQRRAAGALREIARSAAQASREPAARAATLFAQLVEILTCNRDFDGQLCEESGPEIAAFVQAGVGALRDALEDRPESEPSLETLVTEASNRWGDWLELVSDEGPALDETSGWPSHVDTFGSDVEVDPPSSDQLALILATLETSTPHPADGPSTPAAPPPKQTPAFLPVETSQLPTAPTAIQQPVAMESDLLEAYLDDASRCLAMIETSALAFEQRPEDVEPLRQLCRELHTLKGASASVGLADLADYLHRLEGFVESRSGDGDHSLSADDLLTSVDRLRRLIAESTTSQTGEGEALTHGASPLAPGPDGAAPESQETMRVKASQLDRLMDMLSQLVMLRNRRESRVASLQRLNDELIRCVTRLRMEGDEHARHAQAGRTTNPLREIATDVLEIARGQRAVCERISDENLSISRFIRDFRQELTGLRRLPVSGLFRRLQRAVHDAARTEDKQVRLELIGEHAGLERSLQERLYEPLLHIVRNAVSHGIETESQRRAAGKEPGGTVTLEARGGSNMLILEVRDDGRGLDYDAIRRRGVERGLLSPDQPASRAELAQLIFHPGFSTREGANAVSGRGVGMNVVADALHRMRSWVEVESVPGHGTKIRLSVPLRSVIEHTMVFRCGGQLFAVPMQFVRSAGHRGTEPPDEGNADLPTACGCELFGQQSPGPDVPRQRLILGFGRKACGEAEAHSARRSTGPQMIAVLVDEIVGPEEVVVRPLPPLLRYQSLVSGVSLSGTGELLLLLDSQRLVQLGLQREGAAQPTDADFPRSRPGPAGEKPVLVVDDSISARRCLVRHLKQFGLETSEAADGIEALEKLRDNDFAMVFSDLEMPRASGLDLLREMGGDDARRRVPVVIVSSRDEPEFRNQAEQLGAVAYLVKPVAESRVAEQLQRLSLVHTSRAEGGVL